MKNDIWSDEPLGSPRKPNLRIGLPPIRLDRYELVIKKRIEWHEQSQNKMWKITAGESYIDVVEVTYES